MTPELRAAVDRVRSFLDERGPHRHNVIATAGPRDARYAKPRLRADDLRVLLAAVDPAEQPCGMVPTRKGLHYLELHRQQHPRPS